MDVVDKMDFMDGESHPRFLSDHGFPSGTSGIKTAVGEVRHGAFSPSVAARLPACSMASK